MADHFIEQNKVSKFLDLFRFLPFSPNALQLQPGIVGGL